MHMDISFFATVTEIDNRMWKMRAKTNVIVENCNEPVEYNVRAIEKQVPPPPPLIHMEKQIQVQSKEAHGRGIPNQGLFPSYTPQIHMFGPRVPQHQTYRAGRGFNYITTHGFLFFVYIFVFIYLCCFCIREHPCKDTLSHTSGDHRITNIFIELSTFSLSFRFVRTMYASQRPSACLAAPGRQFGWILS